MYSTYRLKLTELNEQFFQSVKTLFGENKEVEIAINDFENEIDDQ